MYNFKIQRVMEMLLGSGFVNNILDDQKASAAIHASF
jgi:hypothetical protein